VYDVALHVHVGSCHRYLL